VEKFLGISSNAKKPNATDAFKPDKPARRKIE